MSKEYPILSKAPITEALIDIRVKLPSALDVTALKSIYESIKKQYPEKQEQRVSKFKIESESDEQPIKTLANTINGYRYISSDKKQIVQTRFDGFTLSRLHPYIKWEELRDEAYKLWQLYKDIASPESITRVAVRYINNLNVPLPIRDFSDCLTAPPTVPEMLPQGVNSFLTRIALHEPSIGANIIITQALEQMVTDVAPIILDIDVFKSQPKGIKEKDVWEIIEDLRNLKNKVFFNSITKTLLETFK